MSFFFNNKFVLQNKKKIVKKILSTFIWAIIEKRGIFFLNPGFVFCFLGTFFVELDIYQIIRKNKQLPI
jgi:hypothetical protein